MTHPATLSEVVGKALSDTGLSDRQIEARTGISRVTLRRRLGDPDEFKMRELRRVAAFLGMKLSDLVALSEERAA